MNKIVMYVYIHAATYFLVFLLLVSLHVFTITVTWRLFEAVLGQL